MKEITELSTERTAEFFEKKNFNSFEFNQLWNHDSKADGVTSVTVCLKHAIADLNQYEAWELALQTFMKLKGHNLAVKAQEILTQYLLRYDCEKDTIAIVFYNGLNFKYDHVSPCFNSEEDSLSAANDIGINKLIHMFKTFQGIYK